jgi:tRNA G18 (ribose-2'-O)-methylase SpoU
MRGYFGIGVEGISKPMNLGGLLRTAHAFGASFAFTVGAAYGRRQGGRADTSDTPGEVPFYDFPDVRSVLLPKGCELVGIELLDEATDLPSFRHPRQAAYVLGPERGSLSPAMIERCAVTVSIPTSFCVNLGIAGAITMYDRLISLTRFAARPVSPLAGPEPLEPHHFGDPISRRGMEKFRTPPTLETARGEKQ